MEALLVMIGRILQVALGIGFVIFVHELGHFLVAKKVGIRVEVFSLGFGPRLLGFRRGTTDYRISAIPLGGYVKMAGENPDEEPTGADDEFAAKPVGSRAAVIVAGVCMNAIFAVIGFLIAFKVGVRMDHAAVGPVQVGSAADQAGLRYGDRILKIGDETPLEFMDIGLAAAYASGELPLTIERRGETKEIRVTPRRVNSPVQQLGFERIEGVYTVEKDSPAKQAGLEAGDWILVVNGAPVKSLGSYLGAIRDSPGKPVTLEVEKDGAEPARTITFTPKPVPARTFGMTIAPTPVISKVMDDSAAADAGLQKGDAVLEIGGAPAEAATLRERIASVPAGEPVKLVTRRGSERLEKAIVPRRDADGQARIGIMFGAGMVATVAPGSPAAAAGIEAGDVILEVAKGPPAGFEADALDGYADPEETPAKAVPFKVWKAKTGERTTLALTPVDVAGKFVGAVGFDVATATFEKHVPGILEPIRLGFNRTKLFIEQVFLTFSGMFAKRIDPSTLGGPIGIAETAYKVSEYGFGKLIYFLAIISVNLAVLNIFPIPILDGGHLVFLGIEKVKGTPVAPSVQAAAQWVGLAMLLGLMIFVTKNDIVRTFMAE
jgi:regulator of sigma E protease